MQNILIAILAISIVLVISGCAGSSAQKAPAASSPEVTASAPPPLGSGLTESDVGTVEVPPDDPYVDLPLDSWNV